MPVRLTSHEEPLPGYKLLERLGRGGFGEVWKVEAPGGLLKAMKFVFGDLDSADEDGRPAEQELKALHRVKSIRHPYILTLERFDVVDGQLIIVMELADRNLWDRFRECRTQGMIGIPRVELIAYMEEVAEALDLMNDHYQIQHLDVKPQNIFLTFNHVKVADFGLAKAFEGMRATVTGGVTPVYAAPETFEGWVSRYSDQYSLAIVFQELLTGTRPFNGANTKQLLLQHLNGAPDLSPLNENDRPVIGRSLSKKPDDRWKTCADMVRALKFAGTTQQPGSGGTGSGATPLLGTTRDPKADTPRPPGLSPEPNTPPGPDRATTRPGSGVAAAALERSLMSPGGFGVATPNPRRPGGTYGTPGLVTPRMLTPQGTPGSGPAATLPRPQVFQTGRMSSLGIAPPEKEGPGVLFPSLVVAVGQTGLIVLRALRQFVRDRFGSTDAVPTFRYLYIDTDPEAITAATSGQDPFAAREVVPARLNRPAHYLQQSAAPAVESWLPPGLLYQLPKSPGPAAGVRAFGRLALCDNYRVIAQRIRQEIETFLTDDPLDKAAAGTGLGVRSNRPRAYVLAGLAGGTGSGMFLDLAYILKHELRAVGYRKPETVGVLLAPPADKAPSKTIGLVNTFAALAEVYHFATGNTYKTTFDANEPAVVDGDGPFARTAIVSLPKPKDKDQKLAYSLAARGVFTELLTTAGKVTDYVRSVTPVTGDAAAPVVQLFGLHQFSWPRVELLTTATRRFNQRLLQRWGGKETAHLREPIQRWLDEQWAKQKLDLPSVIGRFEQVARDALREDPDAVFDAAVDSLRARAAGGGRLDAATACEVLDQLLKWVGKPACENESPGSLETVVQESFKKFAGEIEVNLAALAVSFIEQPQHRLAGAEEALNQITERVRRTAEGLEPLCKEGDRDVREAFGRVLQAIGGLNAGFTGRKSGAAGEVLDALKVYSQKRLRLIYDTAALAVYRGLLGSIPEYLRDVNFCRGRIAEMGQSLGGAGTGVGDVGPGTLILPSGCTSLDDAADRVLAELSPEDILAFDLALQKDVSRKCRGLVNVCLKAEKAPDFLKLLETGARSFLDARLEKANPATVFLRYQGNGQPARDLLAAGFAKAAPDLTGVGGRATEAAILAAPAGADGDRFRAIAVAACPGVEFIPAPLADDILIYRECPRVPLTSLAQVSGAARDAYEQQLATDYNPHTRADLPWPVPGAG
ncbi:tubulin-like doman-containing protein [Fimbriiglobus ruber]|uniref:Serine/threonine protein kinase n=1 Tax=Fimbriiglobus ruber TaxID=1908690 RepID=A0A225DEM6_9BACT|nr:tubulin-like doman-containing protein [Fimbriiglobus ruber]OWK35796.1 serine/threonine protein kinase [Fimbriiglobus ruber]